MHELYVCMFVCRRRSRQIGWSTWLGRGTCCMRVTLRHYRRRKSETHKVVLIPIIPPLLLLLLLLLLPNHHYYYFYLLLSLLLPLVLLLSVLTTTHMYVCRFGEYVLVGVHNDSVVNSHRGINLPIMNLHERVLSVLGCKVTQANTYTPSYTHISCFLYAVCRRCVDRRAIHHHSRNDQLVAHRCCCYWLFQAGRGQVTPPHLHNISTYHYIILFVFSNEQLDMSTDSADSVDDMYALPRQLGILKIVQCSTSLSGY